MLAILTKFAFEVIDVPEDKEDALRNVCDPAYTGPDEPADILETHLIPMDELMELVVVDDDGKVIYDGTV